MSARRRPGVSRPALLAAGFEVIATRGYAAATTAEICRQAGVSSGTFFHYFPTKEDLLLAILTDRSGAPTDATLDALVDEVLVEVADPLLAAFIREVSTLSSLPRVRVALQQASEDRTERLRLAVETEQVRGSLSTRLSVPEAVLRLRIILDGIESLAATAPDAEAVISGPMIRALIADAVGPR